MDLVVYDDDEKRYVPWTVALAAVLLVALVTAGSTFLLARQASGDEGRTVSGLSSPAPAIAPTPSVTPSATAPPSAAAAATPAPVAAAATLSPACVDALLQADGALERAVALDQALTRHTAIMDELLAERIDVDEALDQTLPLLTDGATERRRFEQELSAYSQSRQECPA